MDNIFTQLSLILVLAGIVSSVMKLLKQPLIIGHIFTGLIVGPYALNIINHPDELRDLSQFGIALLLFIIGLGLNPRVIREVGKASTIIGTGQVLFTATVGYVLSQLLGFSPTESAFIAIGLTFSSTIIILKLLSDKKETSQLHGKVATGMLLVQDIIATVVLIITAGIQDGGVPLPRLSMTAGFAILLGSLLYLFSVYVFPRFTKFISNSQEYLFLFSIAWGFGVASVFAAANLSIEVGALFAGVALATQPYASEVSSRLRPLRDFFIVLFFIVLGVELELTSLGDILIPACIFSVFVLLGNPLIVMSIMGILGYTKKTSFKVALTVAQISEFSLIFVLLGNELGLVNQQIVSILTLVGLITIAGSTYMVIYDDKLFNLFEKYLTLFERRKIKYSQSSKLHNPEIILFGFARGGHDFVRQFKKMKKDFLVIDYDPEVIDTLQQQDFNYAYGDMTDVEFLEEIALESTRLVISTVTDKHSNMFITTHMRAVNPQAIVIVHSDNADDAALLYEHGATYVMMPHYVSSERISQMLRKNGLKKSDFTPSREKHLRYVQRHL